MPIVELDGLECRRSVPRRFGHGYEVHEQVWITPANLNDGRAGSEALPDDPGKVLADSAYRGSHSGDAVRAGGGTPHIVATAVWARNQKEAGGRLNAPNHRVRTRIEEIVGTWKRSYGLFCMRWRGLSVRLNRIA